MSLRILLADESTTIKKAFQLALADLGAEIKSVPSGLDVLAVALDFNPTLIFADILLTKKSGYEICREIKEHAKTKHVPVILMWSQFMEFNQNLAEKAQFNDRLEKPFDTEMLRKVVLNYYQKAASHPLKNYIEFPDLSDVEEDFEPVQLEHLEPQNKINSTIISEKLTSIAKDSTIYLETESYGDFEEVVLVKPPQQRSSLRQTNPDLQTRSQGEALQIRISQAVETNILDSAKTNLIGSSTGSPAHQKTNQMVHENLIREEVRIMTEKICWQIIPDLAEKIIREELEKLMTSIEKSI